MTLEANVVKVPYDAEAFGKVVLVAEMRLKSLPTQTSSIHPSMVMNSPASWRIYKA
jgi:hypothetical protein